MSGREERIKVLHVVGGMNTGGVETWLMHVLRRIDRNRYKFDFLTHTARPCFYDQEVLSLGGRIIPCLYPYQPWRYALNFRRIMKEYGPYDVIHSHVHHFSGFALMLAHRAGVPMRIAHSHSDTQLKRLQAGLLRRVYLCVTEWLIRRHATVGLACSRPAAAALYGGDWTRDPRWRVLCCGIDFSPFGQAIDRAAVRKELGIPPDAFVVGHVGRFVEQKNHQFLLDVFAEMVHHEPKAYLLLVGDGPLRGEIEQKARSLRLSDKVISTGVRPDVPRLMCGAMDVFAFPSRCEGLALVLIEAQAAGLRCVFSDVIPSEADIVQPLLQRMCPRDSAKTWARAVLSMANRKRKITPDEAILQMRASPFDISTSLVALEHEYKDNAGQN